MPGSSSIRRPFFFYLCLLAATVGLWLVVTLSERRVHTVTYRIEWVGIDTARYVVKHADTSVSFDILSNGFLALSRAYTSRREPLRLDGRRDTVLSADSCVAALDRQFSLPGVHGISCRAPQVSLRLLSRHVKAFVPQLRGLEVTFADPYALYGTLDVEPDTVWLYGSEASLEHITELATRPTALANVRGTRDYEVELEPVWEQYPDLRVSTTSLQVTIPTARYTERHFSLPLQLEGAPQGIRAHLYPSQVEVSVWVAEQDFARLSADQFQACVFYDPKSSEWRVSLVSFPSYVRLRSIEPETVRYVIIKD